MRFILSGEMAMHRMNSRNGAHGLYGDEDLYRNEDLNLEATNGVSPKKGMILPFTPLAMSFDTVNYYVDMPAVS